MKEHYLEDLQLGDRFRSPAHLVTAEAIVDFGRQFDPQSFHLDPEAGERSIFGGLVASGWHTAAMTMNLFVSALKLAGGSVGLGVDELRWPQPVRPGDCLTLEVQIIGLRPSQTKQDRGVIRIKNVTTNQEGAVVQSFMANVLVRRRPPA